MDLSQISKPKVKPEKIIWLDKCKDKSQDSLEQKRIDAEKLQDRLKSFKHPNWTSKVSTMKLSTAGFRYSGEGDKVYCEICQKKVAQWTKFDDPLETHCRVAPDCPFVLDLGFTGDLHIPKYNRYSDEEARKNSMKNLPRHFMHKLPPLGELVKSGLFYQGTLDRMCCYQCGLILRDWEPSTAPSDIHSQFGRKCLHVLDLVEQEKHGRHVKLCLKRDDERQNMNQNGRNGLNPTNISDLSGKFGNMSCHQSLLDNQNLAPLPHNFRNKSRPIECADSSIISSQVNEVDSTIFQKETVDVCDGPARKGHHSLPPRAQASISQPSDEVERRMQRLIKMVRDMGFDQDIIQEVISRRKQTGLGEYPDAQALCFDVMDLEEEREKNLLSYDNG